jgi:ribose transport system permease protein
MSELKKSARIGRSLAQYGGMVGVLIALVTLFSLMSKSFLNVATVSTIANSIPALTVIAVGMTWVLLIGGIDLSVGSVLALSTAVLGMAMVDHQVPFAIAAILCIAAGGLCGFLNGAISVLAKIPSFIVTLGMLEIARGIAYLVTNSQTKFIGSSVEWIGVAPKGLYVSPAFILAIVLVIVGQLILQCTVFGRYCIAIGSNPEAVRLSGIRAAPYSITVFVLSGMMCGLAGIMETSRLSSVDPNGAIGMELSAIAACVIGGTSLKGGRGSVISTFFGVLVIAVLQTGLTSLGASDPTKRIVTGSVIVAAVLLDAYRAKQTSF